MADENSISEVIKKLRGGDGGSDGDSGQININIDTPPEPRENWPTPDDYHSLMADFEEINRRLRQSQEEATRYRRLYLKAVAFVEEVPV